MKSLTTLSLLLGLSLSAHAYTSASDEINDMISAFDICSADAQNPEIFEKMYKELQSADAKNEENPFYVDITHYTIEFSSDEYQCLVFVDPYDFRCYTPRCEKN